MKRLQDRVAIVTGGASGIGLATSRRFLEEGARLAIWDNVILIGLLSQALLD